MHLLPLLNCACIYVSIIYVCCDLELNTRPPWSQLEVLRISVSQKQQQQRREDEFAPSEHRYVELQLQLNAKNSSQQLGSTSFYLSAFSDSAFVVPSLLVPPKAIEDSLVGVDGDVYRVLLAEGGIDVDSAYALRTDQLT